MLQVIKLSILVFTRFFWIFTFLLFAIGCFNILPVTLKPFLKSDEFVAGEFLVDSMVSQSTKRSKTWTSFGHVIGEENKTTHFLEVNPSEINPSDCVAGKKVTVYFHNDFQKVYLRKKNESINKMPISKVRNPFLFWCVVTLIPFPLFSFINIRYWIRSRKEKRKIKQIESDKWG